MSDRPGSGAPRRAAAWLCAIPYISTVWYRPALARRAPGRPGPSGLMAYRAVDAYVTERTRHLLRRGHQVHMRGTGRYSAEFIARPVR